ncbi:translocation/assembly module TamB domain-containing protein [Spirochaetia bacterium 38H-sp]|uniref:Translocation/assembly module TamB domain-containing protein n=1 Tax=Rarispira pelagica TaxID=3141764 RepID=A0ABU9UAU4_9SPIR
MTKKNFNIKFANFIFIIISLFFLIIGLHYFLFFSFKDKIEAYVESYISKLEDNWYVDVEYEGVSPYIYPFVSVNNIKVSSKKNDYVVYIDRLSLYFNLFDLKNNFINTIRINTVYINYISQNTQPYINYDNYISSLKNIINLIPDFLDYDVHINNITLRLLVNNSEIFINDAMFEYDNMYKKVYLNADILIISDLIDKYLFDKTLKISLSVQGKIEDNISLKTRISLKNKYWDLKPQKFFLRFANDSIEFSSLDPLLPYDAYLTLSLKNKEINFHLETEDFSPSIIVSDIKAKNSFGEYFLKSLYTITLNCKYNIDKKSFIYDSSGTIVVKNKNINYIDYSIDGNNYDTYVRYIDFSTSFFTSKLSGFLELSSETFTGKLNAISNKNRLASFVISSNISVSPYKSQFILRDSIINDSKIHKISFELYTEKKWNYLNEMFFYIFIDAQSGKQGFLSIDGGWDAKSKLVSFLIIADSFPVLPFYDSLSSVFYFLKSQEKIKYFFKDTFVSGVIDGSFDSSLKLESVEKLIIENADDNISFHIGYSDKTFYIKQLTGMVYNLPVAADFNFKEGNAFYGNFSLSDNFYEFYGKAYENGIKIIGDNFKISSKADNGTYAITMEFEKFPVLLKNAHIPVLISFNALGEYHNSKSWKLYVNEFVLKNWNFYRTNNTQIEASLIVFPNRIEFTDFSFSDDVSKIAGSISIAYFDVYSLFYLDNIYSVFFLSNNNRTETYEGAVSLSRGFIDGRINATGVPVNRFLYSNSSGSITTFISFSGVRSSPDFYINLKSDNVYIDGSPLEADLSLLIENKKSILNITRFSYLNFAVKDINTELDIDTGEFSGIGQVFLKVADKNYESKLTILGKTDKQLENFWQIINASNIPFKASFSLDNITLVPEQTIWRFSVIYDGNHFSLKGAPDDSLFFDYSREGDFTLSCLSPLPVQGKMYGKIVANRLEINTELTRIDISPISVLFRFGNFNIESGIAYGSIKFYGDIDALNADGFLNIDSPICSLDLIPDKLSASKITLIFDKNTIEIPESYVYAGDTPALISSLFSVSYFTDISYVININTVTPQPVHVKYNFGILNVDGFVTGNIKIGASTRDLDINGELRVQDARITISQNSSNESNEYNIGTSVNLKFLSGSNVSFLWPSENLPVLKLYSDTNQRLTYTLDSETGKYKLYGNIALRGGEVFYLEKSFYIREGNISFNENENSFDPSISVKAELRDFYDGKPIKIFLIARESPLSEFSPAFESQPFLSQDKLAIILGKSLYNVSSGGETAASLLGLGTDVFTQFAVVRGFEESVKESFGLDIFSVRTHLFQSILTSALSSSNIQENNVTYEAGEDSIGRYLDNTTIIMGKYIGQSAFGELAFNISNNNGLDNSALLLGGVKASAELLVELDTPLFLLSWRLKPENWDTLFVTDQSISINWGFSY